jgi:hypothetical protein
MAALLIRFEYHPLLAIAIKRVRAFARVPWEGVVPIVPTVPGLIPERSLQLEPLERLELLEPVSFLSSQPFLQRIAHNIQR